MNAWVPCLVCVASVLLPTSTGKATACGGFAICDDETLEVLECPAWSIEGENYMSCQDIDPKYKTFSADFILNVGPIFSNLHSVVIFNTGVEDIWWLSTPSESLRVLELNQNPELILEEIGMSPLKSLKISNGIKEIRATLENLPDLEHLSIHYNLGLTQLPEDLISFSSNLHEVSVTSNPVSRLPRLPLDCNLARVWITHTDIHQIPPNYFDRCARTLFDINLGNNHQLTSLPDRMLAAFDQLTPQEAQRQLPTGDEAVQMLEFDPNFEATFRGNPDCWLMYFNLVGSPVSSVGEEAMGSGRIGVFNNQQLGHAQIGEDNCEQLPEGVCELCLLQFHQVSWTQAEMLCD